MIFVMSVVNCLFILGNGWSGWWYRVVIWFVGWCCWVVFLICLVMMFCWFVVRLIVFVWSWLSCWFLLKCGCCVICFWCSCVCLNVCWLLVMVRLIVRF